MKNIISITLCIVITLGMFGYSMEVNAYEIKSDVVVNSVEMDEEEPVVDINEMTQKQKNAIAMLNYITVLTQEINDSNNSKMYLDNICTDIINKVNLNAVDQESLSHIEGLLNTIQAYSSIDTKRERLQYIYNQNQAKTVQKAMPNPMAILSFAQAENPLKTLMTVVYMAVDSKSSYDKYLSEIDSKYFMDNWELDSEAEKNLFDSRKDSFNYMVEMCNQNGIDGDLVLREKTVEEFVRWEKNDNLTRKIEFFEEKQETYKAYGKYWLVLAECYFEKGENEKCLKSISEYEALNANIFTKDYDYAKTLSIAINAAREIYGESEYEAIAAQYADLIIQNTDSDEWSLRYYVAQTYLDLYGRTKNQEYLQKAFNIAKDNVNHLIDTQRDKNKEYLAEIEMVEIDKLDSKSKKKEIKQYNKWVEEERRVELPPVYQPLVVNCDLLFGIAGELNIGDGDKQRINDILHFESEPLFLVQQLEDKYWFDTKGNQSINSEFDGKELRIPVKYLSHGCKIESVVLNGGQEIQINDWILDEVDRNKSNDIENFVAIYKSKEIKKVKYADEATIIFNIIPPDESGYTKAEIKYTVEKIKKLKLFNGYIYERAN